ncbi:MFS transporter [Pediococcus ethanolidurans]|uniref:MFS transporter n=1 Tax=Pediococcus ethanolidurans TaxID=319653 RepID=UPI001C1ED5C0|nr:MFS transporter [Pediococcus ethanolidurans]MBU7554015.1 MFS transporter [Pediococcus ethanolidurans]MBU7563146.1 MFS transporter [Pediococcus ethanolidurans]MCT4398238.1 MFS transporter [Pediococcus ethanolidurans]MCV3314984.1 MFS transporter [Pediococcus ethanolidurans]MCV3322074.1 MFS transporter [Pediococcus ethanolidurans]
MKDQNKIFKGNKKLHNWFVAILLAGTFTMSISQSSLSTAYPTLMRYFGVTAPTIQWLTTGFMLVMCIMMPISPWLLSNVPFKRLFQAVLVMFDVGTIVILFAPNFPLMMFGRVLEAMGVGILFPAYQSVMLTITPEELRGVTMGIVGLVMGSALAVGPIISGVVLKFTSWQGLFVIFAIIITVVFLLSFKFIANVMDLEPNHLDFISVISSLGLIGLLFVINQLGKANVNWSEQFGLLAVSLIMLAYFVYRQFHIKTPMLELRVLKTFNYDLAVLLTGFSYIALIVTTIIFPLYYQEVLHLSPFASGMALVPGAVFLSLLNPVTGKLADQFGFKRVLLMGMSMITLGWGILFIFSSSIGLIAMIILAMLIEGGNAFVMMPAMTLGANSLPDSLISHGTAVITTVRQILGSLGVAVATIILAAVTQSHLSAGDHAVIANQMGYRAVFFTFFLVAIVGLMLSILIKNSEKKS